VRVSFDQPVYTVQTDAVGTIAMLEAIRDLEEQTGLSGEVLPGEQFGDVRQGGPDAANGDHALPSALAVRLRQGLFVLAVVNYRESYDMSR